MAMLGLSTLIGAALAAFVVYLLEIPPGTGAFFLVLLVCVSAAVIVGRAASSTLRRAGR